MFLWLLRESGPLFDRVASATAGDSRVFLTARIAAATVTAFLAALLLGGPVIRWLGGRFRERVDSASERLNALHERKNATPTMGGLFVVAAVVASSTLWGDLTNGAVLLALAAAVAFCAIGAADDWIKLSTRKRGLTARQKLLGQTVVAAAVGLLLYGELARSPHGLELGLPIGSSAVWLGAAFPLWAVFVLVGSSNAVNLTDGLDGLAGGCAVLTAGAMAGLCYVAGHAVWAGYLGMPYVPQAGEVAVVLGALAGAMLGFLWFNCHPAQVFLGDAGSLPVGALLGFGALVSRQEVLLAVAGGVFVVETLSVIAQVGWFKLTGRRLIACSPLHNHFVLRGQHELKVVVRFWIGSAVCAAIAAALLKVR
ncbi:MAG TPA: phospho-N-acetylmuramoyl-pentapeptide-transferase [Planctomycetaceae bacterium]